MRLPVPFALPGIPALSCGHTPVAFQGFSPGTPLNTAGGRRGSFPMSIIEAQQNGVVPIVMDSFLSVHDIIDNDVNGVLISYGNAGMAII